MCRLTGVSRATFYRRRNGKKEVREEERGLRNQVNRIALEWPCYGSRRIHAETNQKGWQTGRKRVQRILRESGRVVSRRPTKFLATTDSKHDLPVFANLTAALQTTRINQLWVTDITYIPMPGKFVFLAAILDAHSRRVIGWALSESLKAGLCIEALERAMAARHFPRGVIHHSDRGVQYCSKDYRALLAKHHMLGSMSRKGNPYDNGIAESFWKTLKYEQIYRQEYRTLEEAQLDIGGFIDKIYNVRRLHSSLGYSSPATFEAVERRTT
jgi:putative transposase